jgi:hypothetical protein
LLNDFDMNKTTYGDILMKKLIYIMPFAVFAALYASLSHADRWDHHHHHGHGHHHHHHPHFVPRPHVNYYPAPIVHYYSAPPVAYVPVPPPPPVTYYSQPPVNSGYYDQRSPQGLAGGVLGSVFGYELGKGDPIATGLGAAAGSYLGNGIGRGY